MYKRGNSGLIKVNETKISRKWVVVAFGPGNNATELERGTLVGMYDSYELITDNMALRFKPADRYVIQQVEILGD